MSKTTISVCLYLWFCFFASSVAADCSEKLTNGYRLDNFTTETISDIGVHSCIKECLLRKPHCQSINYNTQHFQCGINSKGADDVELKGVLDSNSIFVNVLNSSRENLGTCKDALCPNLHKCVAAEKTSFCISTACKAGTYVKEDQYLPCPVGQYNDGSKQWCSYCPPGSYNDETGSSSCIPCPPRTYMDYVLYGEISSASCKPCPAGHYQSASGQTNYLQCPVGAYQDEEGQISCKSCTENTFQDLEAQLSCKDCSNYIQCTNPNRTECHNLKKHGKQHGRNGIHEGNYGPYGCKLRCKKNPECRGFTISRFDDKSCHTHQQRDHYESEWTHFFEYPSDCHP